MIRCHVQNVLSFFILITQKQRFIVKLVLCQSMYGILFGLIGVGLLIGFVYEFLTDSNRTVPFSIKNNLIDTEISEKWVLLAFGLGFIGLGTVLG